MSDSPEWWSEFERKLKPDPPPTPQPPPPLPPSHRGQSILKLTALVVVALIVGIRIGTWVNTSLSHPDPIAVSTPGAPAIIDPPKISVTTQPAHNPNTPTVTCTILMNVGEILERWGPIEPFEAQLRTPCKTASGLEVHRALDRQIIEQVGHGSNGLEGDAFSIWFTYLLGPVGQGPSLRLYLHFKDYCQENNFDPTQCIENLESE